MRLVSVLLDGSVCSRLGEIWKRFLAPQEYATKLRMMRIQCHSSTINSIIVLVVRRIPFCHFGGTADSFFDVLYWGVLLFGYCCYCSAG